MPRTLKVDSRSAGMHMLHGSKIGDGGSSDEKSELTNSRTSTAFLLVGTVLGHW